VIQDSRLEQIEKDVKRVIALNGDFDLSSQELHFSLNAFAVNKSRFYEDFGNEFSITRKGVSVEKNEESKKEDFDSFKRRITRGGKLYEFAKFINDNGIDGFFNNKVLIENDYNIPVGMKLSKSFNLIPELKKDNLVNHWQTSYSQILNDNRIAGDLTISIHPFDYLTMSENRYNWRSCHALDGEYAAGTLGMMNDKTTVVAFLASPKLEEFDVLHGAKWNNKKWRQLVHISPDLNTFVHSKHYPYHNQQLEDLVQELLQEVYPYIQEYILDQNARGLDYVRTGSNSPAYNDAKSSMNGPNVYVRPCEEGTAYKKVVVGTAVACLHCGEYDIMEPEYWSCEECSGIDHYDAYCDNCGEGVYDGDYCYTAHDETLCNDCSDEHYGCHNCGEVYHLDYMHYNVDTDIVRCEHCHEHYTEKEKQKENEDVKTS
jgi:hypothetical protein